ncbi:hypothetical protein FZEAL_8056 [Fusarium zealandicum]|uniref:Xylanolytic transcriptional activator regulatory domain-containing protein n=1 Tax=Fusarium zealandicum TaxID=1053134 RepID=A0A8H4UEI5_9HYPO|nr:hypothetical protein FZEAL_8056 [Fusarium zealandicum]
MSEPERRRRRPAVSAVTERFPAATAYAPRMMRVSTRITLLLSAVDIRNSTRIQYQRSNIDTAQLFSSIFGVFAQMRTHRQSRGRIFERQDPPVGTSAFKTHFQIGPLRDMIDMLEPYAQETSNIYSGLQKCKTLARTVKSRRTPCWPTCLTTTLPPKEITDDLVECYLRTTERIYRILHIPTFREKYEALWASDSEPDGPCLVQLKLVLALGATTYDDKFSLRPSAIRWIYEAQTWLSEPEFKSRLGIQYLQTNILLLFAREAVQISGEPMWIAAGSLLRTAVSMGLHRDPIYLSKKMSLVSEMRRRLWNTILEILLQSSLSSGGPPLISLDDFNTEPPGNFDDDQLVLEDPESRPEHDFTQVSIARALRKTFSCRLSVAKLLNDLNSRSTYDETLRLDAELRASYRVLSQTLQSCKSTGSSLPSEFELCAVDFIMRRYISALHFPFYSPSLHETCYAFSRKVAVETSLKLWCAAYPPSSIPAVSSCSSSFASSRQEFSRFTICGFGFFRTVAWQASLVIAVELRTRLQEEESLCPAPLPSDLLCVLRDFKIWTLRCIQAGETNVKGHLGVCLMTAQIEGLMARLPRDELVRSMIRAGEEAEETCSSILEGMAAEVGTGEPNQGQTPLDVGFDLTEDWEFMMSDGFFDSGDTDPMTWMF